MTGRGDCIAADRSVGLAIGETAVLATAVEKYGWGKGIEHGLDALPFDRCEDLRLSLNYAHTGWMGLLTGNRSMHAIGVDPGLGSILIALSRRFRKVTGFYRDQRLMDMVQARLDWLGITNVAVAPSWGQHGVVAVQDGSVDAVVIYTGEPAALTNVAVGLYTRALREDGTLYVGVEGLAGGRLTVRAMALRARLMRRFDGVDWYRQHHGLMRGDELIAIDVGGRPWWSVPRASIGALRAPAFAIVGRRRSRQQSVGLAALAAIEGEPSGSQGSSHVDRYSMTLRGGAVLAARAGERKVIVRLPFSGEMLSRCEQNALMLCRLEHLRVAGPPRLIVAGRADDQAFFAETVVEGRPLPSRTLETAGPRSASLNAAVEWIARLHQTTAAACAMTQDRMARLVFGPFDRAVSVGGDMVAGEVTAVRNYLQTTLCGQMLPLVLAHGDYSLDNMTFDGARAAVLGVFDWECSADESLPLLDVLYLLFTAELQRSGGAGIAKIYREYFFPRGFDAVERSMLDSYCSRLGVNPALFLALMIMMWAQHVLRIRHDEWYPTRASSTAIVGTPMRAAAAAVRQVASAPVSASVVG